MEEFSALFVVVAWTTLKPTLARSLASIPDNSWPPPRRRRPRLDSLQSTDRRRLEPREEDENDDEKRRAQFLISEDDDDDRNDEGIEIVGEEGMDGGKGCMGSMQASSGVWKWAIMIDMESPMVSSHSVPLRCEIITFLSPIHI